MTKKNNQYLELRVKRTEEFIKKNTYLDTFFHLRFKSNSFFVFRKVDRDGVQSDCDVPLQY